MFVRVLAPVLLVLTWATGAAAQATGAAAQTPESFYRGRTLELIVGFPPGGGYDLFARPVARYLGRYVPGGVNVVVKYMPGAGGILAANYIFNVAPTDGTVLGIISPTSTLDSKLNPSSVRFVASQFNWLGRISPQQFVAFIWHTSPVRTMEQARSTEVVFAGSGAGSSIVVYPTVTNNVLGTRFKVIVGYKGSAESLLAMERGEVQGHVTALETVNVTHPDWITTGKVHLLLQYGMTRHPRMPEVPTVVELARNKEEADILKAVMSAVAIGRSVVTTPGVPADRLVALRRAFDAMVGDRDFVDELHKVAMDVTPLTGEALLRLVQEVDSMPASLVEKVKAVYGTGG